MSLIRPFNRNGYGQPHSTNYHHSEHVTKVAQTPYHPGGTVLHQHVVQKESFKEVDGAKAPAANRRYFDNYPMKANHHGGGSHHRYEAYEETYEESEETYAYGAGRHHGHGHGHGAGAGGHRIEYQTHEETYEEEEEEEEEYEEEVVVGGGGCAQLRRGYHRGA